MNFWISIQSMSKERKSKRGGKRAGAGRPSRGKATFNLSLTVVNVDAAKKRTRNFSATMDALLAEWLSS